MPNFTMNTGTFEVHDLASTQGCLPSILNRRDLGWHGGCQSAVRLAKAYSHLADGCFYCANACHTS